ncbi:transposase, partial [Brevibacillus laterosporus]
MVLSPLSRQCKKLTHLAVGATLSSEGIFRMAKKGQTFQRYTMEFKQKAIALYEQKGISYEAIAKELGVPSPTQIKNWVRKYRDGDGLEDQRGKTSKRDN